MSSTFKLWGIGTSLHNSARVAAEADFKDCLEGNGSRIAILIQIKLIPCEYNPRRAEQKLNGGVWWGHIHRRE